MIKKLLKWTRKYPDIIAIKCDKCKASVFSQGCEKTSLFPE
jgi:hypothetical protein